MSEVIHWWNFLLRTGWLVSAQLANIFPEMLGELKNLPCYCGLWLVWQSRHRPEERSHSYSLLSKYCSHVNHQTLRLAVTVTWHRQAIVYTRIMSWIDTAPVFSIYWIHQRKDSWLLWCLYFDAMDWSGHNFVKYCELASTLYFCS